MASEKGTTNPELAVASLKSEPDIKTRKEDASPVKDDINSDMSASITSSGVDSACANDKTNCGGPAAYTLPTSGYSYYYPGSDLIFSQTGDNGQFCFVDTWQGSQLDDCSYVYYMPDYSSYAAGYYMGYDGQVYYAPSYALEACYYWDSAYDFTNGSSSQTENSISDPMAAANFDGSFYVKSNANGADKFPLNRHAQAFEPLSKGNQAAVQSTFSNQRQSRDPYDVYMNRNPNGRFFDRRDRYRKPDRNGESDASAELTCGPRAREKVAPSESQAKPDINLFAPPVHRDKFNLPDFQIEYEDARFFIIKSYSEDDIHKSVKYSVWSSTPNGNKKLDVAFRDAEAKSREDGKKRPIFLFFSVNSSRQFVGLAEMVGNVDFNKDLDFWQVDKWTGFFPVQWHVIKDIPNRELCHIILENNENKPVTHTRDTHEIPMKGGLEMLAIFKNYTEKSSLLDDFGFYEEREKTIRSKKEQKLASLHMDIYRDSDFTYDYEMDEDSERMRRNRNYVWTRRSNNSTPESLVSLTKNLSLESGSTSKNNGSKNPNKAA